MGAFDPDRFISVRASVLEDGEARIRELEAELAVWKDSANSMKSAWHSACHDIERLTGENERLRECLKRLEWCDKWGTECPDDCCPACSGLRPRNDHGYSHLAEIGHKGDCWLAAEIAKEGLEEK